MRCALACLFVLFFVTITIAEDCYYIVKIEDLGTWHSYHVDRAEVDVEGDAFVIPSANWSVQVLLGIGRGGLWDEATKAALTEKLDKLFPKSLDCRIVVHTTKKTDFTVTLNGVKQPISVSADQALTGDERMMAYNYYILCRHNDYARLVREDTVGRPIFQERHLHYGNLLDEILKNAGIDTPHREGVNSRNWVNEAPLAGQFDLFSGAAAIRGNLDLRTVPSFTGEHARTVDVNSVTGITVPEIDWKSPEYRLSDAPVLDPLAYYVPEDQHFVVFPSVKAAQQVLDAVAQFGLTALTTPLAMNTETASNADWGLVERYLHLLGLGPATQSSALNALVKSVAVTGSDPYFKEGTDVAVLFETDDAKKLRDLLPDPSYRGGIMVIDSKTVLATNSFYQVERIKNVIETKKSLAALDEFRYYRSRYKVGDPDETAFVYISDATIRRWCSPKWRIGQTRRLQQQARMAAHTVQNMSEIVRWAGINDQVKSKEIFPPDGPLAAPELRAEYTYYHFTNTLAGVRHSRYGSYSHLTPIAELGIDKISETEKKAYEQWRDRFEGIWQGKFDPIGIRLTLGENFAKTDLTVLPVNRTSLRQFGPVGGEALAPTTARYDLPMQMIASLNPDSGWLALKDMEWLGNYASIYFDEDPFWKVFLPFIEKSQEKHLDIFAFDGSWTIPVVLEIASKNKASLEAFLDKVIKDFDLFENAVKQELQHGDQSYFSLSSVFTGSVGEQMTLYIAPTENRLLVSMNEETLKRALDRKVETTTAWQGSNICLKFDKRAVGVLSAFLQPALGKAVQSGNARNAELFAWYKERFPKEDPVQLHKRLFGERLLLPEEMPRRSPLTGLQSAEFGITLENDGLRAKGEVFW